MQRVIFGSQYLKPVQLGLGLVSLHIPTLIRSHS